MIYDEWVFRDVEHVYLQLIKNALYDAFDSRIGARLHVMDKEERNDLMFSLQRNAVILYPCPVNHDHSIPFDYPPMEIRLYYLKETSGISRLAEYISDTLASAGDLVIM